MALTLPKLKHLVGIWLFAMGLLTILSSGLNLYSLLYMLAGVLMLIPIPWFTGTVFTGIFQAFLGAIIATSFQFASERVTNIPIFAIGTPVSPATSTIVVIGIVLSGAYVFYSGLVCHT